jgi:pyoverdine/dityrosine biosynthesis protein Dit1
LRDIQYRVRTSEKDRLLFNGIHRFIYEDQRALWPELTNNRIRELTKEIAYQVIQRSNAWSSFIQIKFQHAVRLSIHPRLCGSEKLGIHLIHTKDAWATPWHSVVLKQDDDYTLLKKKDAEELGAVPVYHEQRFSHYALEGST